MAGEAAPSVRPSGEPVCLLSAPLEIALRAAIPLLRDRDHTSSTATTPGVINELRVRCVAVSSRPNSVKEFGEFVLPAYTLPAYTLYGRLSSDADRTWHSICSGPPYTGDKMEVRTFVSANVPLRRRCPDASTPDPRARACRLLERRHLPEEVLLLGEDRPPRRVQFEHLER